MGGSPGQHRGAAMWGRVAGRSRHRGVSGLDNTTDLLIAQVVGWPPAARPQLQSALFPDPRPRLWSTPFPNSRPQLQKASFPDPRIP